MVGAGENLGVPSPAGNACGMMATYVVEGTDLVVLSSGHNHRLIDDLVSYEITRSLEFTSGAKLEPMIVEEMLDLAL